jgi:hypothetical protein
MSDLPAPDPQPVDLLRVQSNGKEMQFSIGVDVFEDASTWGFLLADLARQIAQALSEDGKGDRDAILRSIRDTFAHDLSDPSGGGE